MPIWKIVYYPESGENNSPFDYIDDIDDSDERADIFFRMTTISERELADWPHEWTRQISGKVYELKTKNYRIMYFLEGKTIVLLHACRKVKNKTDKRDLNRAMDHYRKYFESKD